MFPPYWTHWHRGGKPLDTDKYIITVWLRVPQGDDER